MLELHKTCLLYIHNKSLTLFWSKTDWFFLNQIPLSQGRQNCLKMHVFRYVLTNFNVVHVYSHCTSILAVCETLPQSPVASHLYTPASPLVMLVSFNTFVVTCWPLGLIQDTTSEGSPDAWHVRVTSPPSVIVWLSIAWMNGRAKDQEPVMINNE